MMSPLGDLLGRLSDPPREIPFEAERLALVDRLVTAGMDAPHPVWQEAVEAAVDQVVTIVSREGELRLTHAADAARMPARHRQGQSPDAEYQDQLRHRLLAATMPLERFEGRPPSPDLTRQRAMALETAWDEIVVLAAAERRHWARLGDQTAAWRRPTSPLWLATAGLLGLTLLTGCWLGGVLAPPTWFRPVSDLFWSLPWWS